nr:MAG TPA_asm: hypothetical protein [Caudoviricetes sp.]
MNQLSFFRVNVSLTGFLSNHRKTTTRLEHSIIL